MREDWLAKRAAELAAVDLGCQDSGEPLEGFFPGQRCRIVGVHHAVFAGDIGKQVVVLKVCPEFRLVWAHDDKPLTYRFNRQGRKVVASDPRCIQSLYGIQYLRPVRAWPWGPSTG